MISNKASDLYAFNLNDKKLADKAKLEGTVNDAIKWRGAAQEGLKEDYEEKQLQAITNPIMQGPYSGALPGAGGGFLLCASGDLPGASQDDGPPIYREVDTIYGKLLVLV